MDILTREHRQFFDFANMLGDELKEHGCDMTSNKPHARNILENHFPNIDIDATFKYFESRCGHCDCEIMYNIACDPIEPPKPKPELIVINNKKAS